MHSPLVLGALLAYSVSAVAAQQSSCNGYPELCSKPYNSLTYVLTHNSYGFTENPGANQMCSINTQLSDGVRGLKLSAVKPSNGTSTGADAIRLCHTDCRILDAGPAKDTLTSVAAWLKSNPNEVLTIMWNNMGKFTAADFQAAYEASGILDYTYTQTEGNLKWPTLQEMISSGKRVVNFLDSGADQASVPWLMSEFNYVFETPYNNMNESSFSCVIDRPADPAQPANMMYVMNHFLYKSVGSLGGIVVEVPQKDTANVTNANSLLNQAQTCSTTFGRAPNFLEVDFYNKGNTLQIAAQLNNVAYKPSGQQCSNQAAPTDRSNSQATSITFSPMLALFGAVLAALVI
ncbi:hypothetical protein DFQ28_007693 [Apophysomyces sp. BC1034]|nr:hypothetical protein DFQ30_004496 [Apophysomyces sp. BC1015]KAG0177167.1 hypothetical protein DFQ29_005165 [Apophysomyces sp. BC1021]KAG0192789.1 hypothetical protein DFQ28_007693 [Apophysomyces sp. BC1034]